MSEAGKAKRGAWFKATLVGLLGLGGGAAGTYATAVVERVAKPAKPVANFSVSADGLAVTCQNHATGESGWWDFGDGSPLEEFAAEQPATHTYAKPGNYTVKLTVRNYFGDENERSVPVELGGTAAGKESPAPLIAGFAVTPIDSRATAPATFRVTADVINADSVVWDFGDGRTEAGEAGKIDRLVTFDKPGGFPVQLFAHSKKQAVKQAAAVKVETPLPNDFVAILKVTDSGSQVNRVPRSESVAVAMPTGKNAPQGFAKVVHARAGFTIAEATLAKSEVAAVKNLKVAVSADKRSVTISGEWAGDQKTATKASGGSDAIIPLKMIEEQRTTMNPAVTMVTGTVNTSFLSGPLAFAKLPLPPAVPGLTREFQLEIRYTNAQGMTTAAIRTPADGKGSMKFPWADRRGNSNSGINYSATLEGDSVTVRHWYDNGIR